MIAYRLTWSDRKKKKGTHRPIHAPAAPLAVCTYEKSGLHRKWYDLRNRVMFVFGSYAEKEMVKIGNTIALHYA